MADGVDKVADERVEALYWSAWHATSISFSMLRLERDYVDAAYRRLTQLTGCRRARKGVQCLFLALFCRANRAERCPVSGGDLNRSTQHLLILLDKEVADGDVTDIVHGEAEG
jgi:hypothetical protein